ncbi:hypothetical protein BJV82DRAFT_83730 [Fennellomyces sp. T-0311]|nr:hypothetical protein BJV82DRAFT_83730 [Fennellomyces sp. T-0311]
MAESSKAGSSRSSRAGLDSDQFLEKMLYGTDADMMDLDDLEEALKDNTNDDEDDEDDWFENEDAESDNEITQLLDSTKEARLNLKTGGIDEIARDFEEFEDNLITTAGIGKVRHGSKRRITTGEARLPPEVKELLGKANELYITQDYGKAVDFLQNLITKYPNVHQAWNTLGLVHEEMGNNEKSLQLRMVAAHMNQNDANLWKELGVKSIEANANQQAVYCFSKAITADPTDVDALWDRSFLYRKLDRIDDAIDGFRQILDITPHHFKVINELAQLYRHKGMINDAIQLYEKAVEHHMKNDNRNDEQQNEEEDEFLDQMGFTEINMLSELYLMQNDYRRALETIKTGVRIVQHREHERYWDGFGDNDQEYFEDSENEGRSDFPIELRVRMGVCRVYLGDVKTAAKHFQYLLNYPPTTYPDLHQDIAFAYMDKRHYEPALSVFQKIIDVSDEVEVDMLIRTADCYHQVGELETASIFYSNVLEEHPENLDVMLSLASVYEEMGKEEAALELVDYVMKQNRESRRKKKEEEKARRIKEGDNKTHEVKPEKASIFDEASRQISKSERNKRRREERIRRDEEKNRNAIILFAKIAELDQSLGDNIVGADKTIMREYMSVAQELYLDFAETTAFYPNDRSRRFTGFYNQKKRSSDKRSLDREAHQMAQRLRGRVSGKSQEEKQEDESDEEVQNMHEEEERDEKMRATSVFRGATFDVWCDLFIKYGYILAQTRNAEAAYDMLKRVTEANVFYHDMDKLRALKFALLGCAMINNNEVIKYEVCRWFIGQSKFKAAPYRLMAAVNNSGLGSLAQFADNVHMKYITRVIHLVDMILLQEHNQDPNSDDVWHLKEAINALEIDRSFMQDTNFAELFTTPTEQDKAAIRTMQARNQELPKSMEPVILNVFGLQLCLGRSFTGACLMFMRSYALEPNDPVNLLSLGISFIMRAMNRKSTNRHAQIMQGFFFLSKYRRLRGRSQETEYNYGRAFHMIGLTHLAVSHYEKVLIMPSPAKQGKVPMKSLASIYEYDEDEEIDEFDETDLKQEAAYNLHLIYVTSGSSHLAKLLIDKYCCI